MTIFKLNEIIIKKPSANIVYMQSSMEENLGLHIYVSVVGHLKIENKNRLKNKLIKNWRKIF